MIENLYKEDELVYSTPNGIAQVLCELIYLKNHSKGITMREYHSYTNEKKITFTSKTMDGTKYKYEFLNIPCKQDRINFDRLFKEGK